MSERRGGSCLGVLGTMLVVGAVVVGTVVVAPGLDLGDLRDAVRSDQLDGVPGSGGEGYTFLRTTSSGRPVTWPCDASVEIVVNPQGAPEGYADLVATAASVVGEASGFDLQVVGETDDRDLFGTTDGPVLVAWADEEEVPELAGLTAGLGGSVYQLGPGGGGVAVGGTVVLDTDQGGWWWRDPGEAVLVHELGHVLGLGHSDDPSQLMHAEHHGQAELGEHDLAGLRALREHACR